MLKFKTFRIVFILLSLIFIVNTAEAGIAEIQKLPAYEKTEYYGMYFNGQKMGWRSLKIAKDRYGNMIMSDISRISQSINGKMVEMEIISKKTFDKKGQLNLVDFVSKSPVGESRIRGVVTGSQIALTSFTGGRMSSKNVALGKENIEDQFAVSVAILNGTAKAGQSFRSSVFDPSIKRSVVVDEKIITVEKRMLNGVANTIYITEGNIAELSMPFNILYNDKGETLEMNYSTAFNFKLESKKRAQSKENMGDIVLSSVIKTPQAIDISAPGKMDATFKGIKDELMVNNERQKWIRLDKDTASLKIARENISAKDALFAKPQQQKELAEYLSEEANIQTSDPRIVKRAGQLKKGVDNSFALTAKILDWVYSSMEKKYTPTFSNASEAIESMEGDCGEHAVLFVALARAAGIPAREVTGIVYSPDVQGFGYHAWAEVWLGKWVSVDPSWNQFPVDASHIAFAFGGIEKQVKIISVMGLISIESLEVTK